MKNNIIEELKWRGLLNNVTNETKLLKAIAAHKAAYIGFDPSAKSLHLGNYVMIMMIKRLTKYNIKSYAVVGGATGMIGDPSGKSNERNLLDMESVECNKKAIILQLKQYGQVEVLDNYDNFQSMNILEFLRKIGKFINVNYMLEKDTIKNRLDTGISFTEFAYTLIQGYDFLKYYQEKNIAIQIGGSDQWGNITTGCEMIRKSEGDDNLACGLTINLLLKSDGTKFGKSEKGAIYLDGDITSPYEMFQFLITQDDSDVINLLKFLTMLSQEEIQNLELQTQNEPKLKMAQKRLAEIVVIDVHGNEQYTKAIRISQALFNGDINSLTKLELLEASKLIPSVFVDEKELSLVQLLIKAKIAPSNREARQLINSGSIAINGLKEVDENKLFSNKNTLFNEFTVIKKGKRNYFIIKWH